jgi:hypothetical protein
MAALCSSRMMCSDSLDAAAVTAAWLNCLPLTADAVEAVEQHELLARLLAAGDVRVLGPVRGAACMSSWRERGKEGCGIATRLHDDTTPANSAFQWHLNCALPSTNCQRHHCAVLRSRLQHVGACACVMCMSPRRAMRTCLRLRPSSWQCWARARALWRARWASSLPSCWQAWRPRQTWCRCAALGFQWVQRVPEGEGDHNC